jgi:hypothetical protein
MLLTHEQGIKNKFTVRGVVRGASLALCAVNIVGCGLAYTFGKRGRRRREESLVITHRATKIVSIRTRPNQGRGER